MAGRRLLLICVVLLSVPASGCGRRESESGPPPSENNTAAAGPQADSEDAAAAQQSERPSESESAGERTDHSGDVSERSDHRSEGSDGSRTGSWPALAPLPDVPVPADNPLNEAKVALGRLLFFDNRLSGDLGTSCASCHDPRLGWGDGQGVSRGYAGTQHWRNSQTTVNAAFYSRLFWAGEAPSLEAQAKSAITGNLAGNGDPAMIEERLAQIPEYVALFREAFGVDRPTFPLVLRAIASFERQELISRDSPFDRFLAGDEQALSEAARRGLALFEGRAGCIRCHNGPLMSDEDYHYLDVPQNEVFRMDPLRQVSLRYQHSIRGVPEDVYRHADRDLGLYYTTGRDADRGRFRTPGLRYLEYTAPYMHNGVFSEIEEVIAFYNRGGGDDPNQSPLIRPLNLSNDEQADLAEFLYSLSGSEIRMNVPILPEYEVQQPIARQESGF